MQINELKFWVSISKFGKIGPSKFKLLCNYFPTAEEIWQSPGAELMEAGLDQKIADEFCSWRMNINPDKEIELMEKENVQAVTIRDIDYPHLLKEIHSAPYILYYRGDLNNISEQSLAIVGTRHVTHYGQQITKEIAEALAEQKICVVSGLALGVDTIAHTAVVNCNGSTVAVLGGGIDKTSLYPACNRSLTEQIINKNGLIVSEFPIGTIAMRHHFPIRNRIISGLSLGTIVIEAGQTSGALITAKFALEQNREVFSVPGNINNPMSIGTNNLIKQGAKLVTNINDILEELNFSQLKLTPKDKEIIPDSPEEAMILKNLTGEPLHINQLAQLTNISIAELNSLLIMLEMKGHIKNIGNNVYSR